MARLKKKEIVAILNEYKRNAVGFSDTTLARERETVMRNYDGERPKPLHRGNSPFISPDVYEAVESLKAQLLETFSGNQRPVRFGPQGADDVAGAFVATEYTDYVVMRQNNGFEIYHDVIHDGLTARVGGVKVFWEKKTRSAEVEIAEPIPVQDLEFIAEMPQVEEIDAEVDEFGMATATIKATEDISQVRIYVIAPEDLLIEDGCIDYLNPRFIAERMRKTESELLEMGLSRAQIKRLFAYQAEDGRYNDERQIRERAVSDNFSHEKDDGGQDALRELVIFDGYALLDINEDGEARRYHVTWSGSEMVEMEEADDHPYILYVPLRRPHMVHGNNFAKRVIPVQTAKSLLTRSVIDHALITTNPRYQVLRNAVRDANELLDQRIGGVVNVNRPDAITPLMSAPLNPFVFNILEMLDTSKEADTGVSKISQGLNKDAISKQNSADMINQLVTLSQQRQKIIARNFANGFLTQLYLRVYQLVIQNEKREHVIDVAGQYVNVTPEQWRSRRDVIVEFHIGYRENEARAAQTMQTYGALASDPALAPLLPLEKRYNWARRLLETMGVKDTETYLLPADQVPPPQPSPVDMLQLEGMKKQIEIADREQTLDEQIAAAKAQREALNAQIDMLTAKTNAADKAHDARLEDKKFAHKKVVDLAELALVASAPPESMRGIASPNS